MTRLRLLAVTGTRADLGLWLPVLREAESRSDRVDVSVLVTAMHLDARFGETVREVRAAGVRIAAEVPCTPAGDSHEEMAQALGVAIVGIAPVLASERPDWLLLLGDRGEQAAAALAALHLGRAIAHLHGGEITRGAVDDTLRDIVTRTAHLHLAATQGAARRLQAMGEERWRIRVVGAPGLDQLSTAADGDLGALRNEHGLGPGDYLLLVQHPETVGDRDGVRDLAATLSALAAVDMQVLAVLPNADAGGRAMAASLQDAAESGQIRVVSSLARGDYATLLRGASALVGNSSSGIIEAPMLGVPAVNIGARQEGRERGDNVIDVPPEREAIEDALERVLDPAFRRSLSHASPYGDGRTATLVLEELERTPIDQRLMTKRVGQPPVAGSLEWPDR
jgi:GDP/UDP-N,N'-diacetylbacillosamine 2-epimerase (hydrolysing)